jgi:hypothetical protein
MKTRPSPFVLNLLDRGSTSIGLLCLIATLWLLPVGVRTVQAGDAPGGEARAADEQPSTGPDMSIDPALVEASERAGQLDPRRRSLAAEQARPLPGGPAVPGDELAPGDIVLNPRGYNYDSDLTDLGPAALNLEQLLNR